MKQVRWFAGLMLAVAVLLTSGTARAERTPTARTSGQHSTGSRTDITVPYLTTGNSAFMPGYVQPKIYASPQVDDPVNPQVKPVYNLPFYGAVQGFGDRSDGAVPRKYPISPR